jgi:AraC-like DNA-binding protein
MSAFLAKVVAIHDSHREGEIMSEYDMHASVSFASRPQRPYFDATPIAETPTDSSGTILPILNEDLAHLRSILTVLGLETGYRTDGVAQLDPEVPLYLPCGRRRGSLGVVPAQHIAVHGSRAVIEALLSITARAISERWFRLLHRQAWILAAAPGTDRGDTLLLALDQQLTVQGVDHRTRATNSSGRIWSDFFLPMRPMPSLRGRADVPLRLTGAGDGAPWIGVLTRPDCDPHTTWSPQTLAHTRPRGHMLRDMTAIESPPRAALPTLTSGMLRRVEDFIESHLETPLSVERLAGVAGLSRSHFTRAFRHCLKMTPHKYVMWRRLLRAQELIRSSDMNANLADIALAAGFADQSHLSRTFRLGMGESPSRFRQRCRCAP